MARFLSSLRLRALAVGSLASFGSLVGLAACTALLGDFEVTASNITDTGVPETTPTTDGGQDAPGDVQPDAPVNGFGGARAIGAGARHTCAIANVGEVFCWGDNTQGQLAQPTSIVRLNKPRKVDLTGAAKKLSVGANHTCVIMMNDDIQCWGANASGQSGTGDQTTPAQPHVVRATPVAAKQWAEVSAGVEHTCAIDQGGQTYCWGANNAKQSGSIAVADQFFASNAGAEKNPFASIASANNHTCARVLSATGMRCWGTEDKGSLGNGLPASETSASAVPVAITTEIKDVAVGGGHTCALDANGDARCWGDNTVGQLGISPAGSSIDAPDMSKKIGTQPLANIAAGGRTSCGISVMNRVLACVGSNESGQLGRGGSKDTSPHADPLPVQRPDGSGQPLEGVATVSVGRDHVCAVVGMGLDVYCWGDGADGQLGDAFGGQARTLPVRVGLPE
jgi:alpha-tubulin suppressor-like RCC1 family protein